MKFENEHRIIYLIAILSLSVISISHYFNFFKLFSGNPIIYAICAKEFSLNNNLYVQFKGLDEKFFCNFHSYLSTFTLGIFYKLLNPTVLTSKIYNFVLISSFVIYFIYYFKELELYKKLYILITWLSIPLVFESFHVVDPDSNLGLYLIIFLFFTLKKNLNAYKTKLFLSFFIFLIIWNKELTGIVVSLSLLISSALFKQEIFFKILFINLISWFLFVVSYLLISSFYNLPGALIIEIFYRMSSLGASDDLMDKLLKISFGLKGILKWVGINFILFSIILLFQYKNIKNIISGKLEFSEYFTLFGLSGSILIILLSGSYFPRYTITFLFPTIFIIYKYFNNYNLNINFNFTNFILIFLFIFALIVLRKDLISSSSNITPILQPSNLYKFFILLMPLIFYLIYNYINYKFKFNKINILHIIIFLILPNLTMIFYNSLSIAQTGSNRHDLKGYKKVIEYVQEKQNKYNDIFIDHIDISYYLDKKTYHIFHPSIDIPDNILVLNHKNIEKFRFLDNVKKSKLSTKNYKYLIIYRNQIMLSDAKKIAKSINPMYSKNCLINFEDFNILDNC